MIEHHPYISRSLESSSPSQCSRVFDIHCKRQARCRINTSASDIDKESSRLTIQSSTTIRLGRIRVYWIAYPTDREHIFSISLNMMDLPRAKPTADVTHHQIIDFSSRIPFWMVPSVFVALNMLDFDCTQAPIFLSMPT
ncbi:hypothetical protein BJV78DRAFT_111455 [Lactifluus subvellereus]|nr:hypothetical protein BJV78DRAFT_111455 [Lactifluus subvellereus]